MPRKVTDKVIESLLADWSDEDDTEIGDSELSQGPISEESVSNPTCNQEKPPEVNLVEDKIGDFATMQQHVTKQVSATDTQSSHSTSEPKENVEDLTNMQQQVTKQVSASDTQSSHSTSEPKENVDDFTNMQQQVTKQVSASDTQSSHSTSEPKENVDDFTNMQQQVTKQVSASDTQSSHSTSMPIHGDESSFSIQVYQPLTLHALCFQIVGESIRRDIEANLYQADFIVDYADSGSEYDPNEERNILRPLSPSLLEDINEDDITEESEHKKSRKRQRNESNWKRNVRKLKRAKGEAYVNVKGNTVPSKQPCVDDCICSCPNKCPQKVLLLQRVECFENFYALASFNLQNSYLCSLIDIARKARTYTNAQESRRQRTCSYFIPGEEGQKIRVCKKFFLKPFQVSDGRVSRLIQNKASNSSLHLDERGKAQSKNKTPEEKINEVKDFVNRFPSYESHYTRHKSEKKYLAPELNISIMYNLYKESCSSDPVSLHIFRQVFNNEFNLSFHVPLKDTCKKCDAFNNKINFANENEKNQIKQEKELHQRKADSARAGMTADTEAGGANTAVIAFDLMKTLPTPVISTGVCYYKRQLWTYCLGIHDLVTNKAYMYVWDESIGSRGPQEIGSCILHYIKNFVTAPNLIMYSDQCGGQNRNIKIAVLCQYIVPNTDFPVTKIDHKFLVSGHSYLPCDQDFGLIEKQKKYFKDIYGPHDWKKVIAAARKKSPFIIVPMDSNMMYSTKKLEKNITNRKKNLDKEKVEWLKFQWVQYCKEDPFGFKYKYSNQVDVPFETVSLKKRTSTLITNLDLLYPEGNTISEAKKKDLLELLHYIPPHYHEFYKALKTNVTDRDVGLVDDSEDDNV